MNGIGASSPYRTRFRRRTSSGLRLPRASATVGTSLHHALCHLLGGMFDAPHAQTHAIVLPYAIACLQPAVPDAVRNLA